MALEVDAKELMTIFSNSLEETQLAKLFSGEAALKTPEQSLLFVKKFVAIGASNLLYLRNAFPENAFKNFTCDGGMKLNLLCPIQMSNNSDAIETINTLIDVLEAVERKHVEELSINILYRDTDGIAVTESFKFHFEYNDEIKVTLSKDNNDEVEVIFKKNAKQLIANTRTLIRQIQITCTRLEPIPEDAKPKVAITVTPNSNAPNPCIPGWVTLKNSVSTGTERENTWLGQVGTSYHTVRVQLKAHEGESEYFKEHYK
jgi:hypothetical protein